MTDATRQTPPWDSIPAMLRDTAQRDPDGAAVVTADLRVAYAALTNEVTGAARALMAAGVEPGDRVAIWAPNSPEWIAPAPVRL